MDLSRMHDAMRSPTLDRAPRDLDNVLFALRQRLSHVGGLATVAWTVLGISIAMVVAMLIDAATDLPAIIRLMGIALALTAGTIVAVRLASRLLRQRRAMAIARTVDRHRTTGIQLSSGVDLLQQRPATKPQTLADGLAAVAIGQSAQFGQSLHPATIYPQQLFMQPIKWLGGATLAAICLSVTSPRLVGTELLRFLDPLGDHPPFSLMTFAVRPGAATVVYGRALEIAAEVSGGSPDSLQLVIRSADGTHSETPMLRRSDGTWSGTISRVTDAVEYAVRAPNGARSKRFPVIVATIPRIEGVEVVVTPPAYTRRPAYVGPLPPEGVRGLPGTQVEVHATSNRPLRAGAISGTVAGNLSVRENQPTVARGSFTIQAPGVARLSVTDIAGQTSTETTAIPIRLDADRRPTVSMRRPINPSYATPDATIDVQVEAEDDFGLSNVMLYRSLNNSRPLPLTLEVPASEPTRFQGHTPLSLGSLRLQPGDTLKLFARAEDNLPSGHQGSESDVGVIHILSQAQVDAMVLARDGLAAVQARYEAARQRLDAAAEAVRRLEAKASEAASDAPITDRDRAEVAQLTQQMRKDADEIEAAARRPLPVDLDRSLTPQLDALVKRLREAADRLATTQPTANDMRTTLSAALKDLVATQQQFDQATTQPIADLAKVLPLLAQQQRYLQLTHAQRSLADRMAAATTQPSADADRAWARRRELEQEQQALAQELAQTLDQIHTATEALPTNDERVKELRETARTFEQAVRKSSAPDAMRQAGERLAADDPSTAARHAADAAKTLESFIGHCNSTGDAASACLRFNPSLGDALGQSVEQLLSASAAGTGNGAGGYSIPTNTAQNVGLYGVDPLTPSQPPRMGEGGRSDRGVASDGRSPSGADARTAFQQRWQLDASGAGDVPVPAPYRQQVSDYFERVVTELSGDAKP